jgi:two-component system NtrC family sensor kinase
MTSNVKNSEKRGIPGAGDRTPGVQGAGSLPSSEIMHLSRLITIGELSACFAHEVFNPLMLIRGHLRLIDEGIAPDHPLRNNLDVIQRASKRIEEMADRMLDFSRKRTPQTEQCDPGELARDALHFLQPYLNGLQIDVQINIDRKLPQLRIDRWEMVQALVNLIQNATEAMANSERRVLRMVVADDDGDIRISISDTGPGISAADLPRVFNPFFTTKGELGTGLGLYIAKRVVEEHSGTVTVQTNRNGTTFVIHFPGTGL